MRWRPVVLALALQLVLSQVALASHNTGRHRTQYHSGIYDYYTRYYFESDFPTSIGGANCRSRMSDGALQWNNLGRELRFANATGTSNYIIVKWDDLAWPNTSAWGITTNYPFILDIISSALSINATPDHDGGTPNPWLWYCGTGTPDTSHIDMWSVAAHEFGHTVELLHDTTPADTMYPYINVHDISRRSLTTHDGDSLRAMYAAAS